jgi:hypothetical protein
MKLARVAKLKKRRARDAAKLFWQAATTLFQSISERNHIM